MKHFAFALYLLTSFLQPSLMAAETTKAVSKKYEVVGRFVKPRKSLGLPYETYFIFRNSKGHKIAFPLINKSKIDLTKVDYSQLYHIEVQDGAKEVTVGESKKTVRVLLLVDGKMFNMKDLAVKLKTEVDPLEPAPEIPDEKSPRRPEMRINDDVANAAIFTAGSLLLGTMLLGK